MVSAVLFASPLIRLHTPFLASQTTAPTITPPKDQYSPAMSPRMIVPADEMLFDCEDVLDRLLPCIRQILDYLRAQGRHPDTSLLAPTELFRATGLYFTGDEINRLLEAFNGEPLADQVRAGSYGMPEPLPPCIGTRALLSVLRARLSTVTYRRPGGGRRPKSGAARPKSAGPKTGGSQRGSGAGIWKKSGEGGGPPSAAPSDSGAGETPLQLEHARAALAQAEMEGYGPEAIRVRRSEVVELSNQRAVQMLAKGELPTCDKLLDEAQRLLDYEGELSPLAAVTANNLACYYRRKQQLDKALHQLRRASQIEAQCARQEVRRTLRLICAWCCLSLGGTRRRRVTRATRCVSSRPRRPQQQRRVRSYPPTARPCMLPRCTTSQSSKDA